jgi:hypothetical protein
MTQSTTLMNKKRAFTLIETVIAVGLVVFAAAALLEIFGVGIKNIDRLSSRADSKYFTTFIINDDNILPLGSEADFAAYITSKYPIDNQKVMTAINGIKFKKSEEETSKYMVDARRQNIFKGYQYILQIKDHHITIQKFKEDGQ